MSVTDTNQFAGMCILKWCHHVRVSHCQMSTLASPPWGTDQTSICCAWRLQCMWACVCHTHHCFMCIVWHNQHSMFKHNMAIFKQTCATSHDAQHKCSGQTVMFGYLCLFPGWTIVTNLNDSDLYNCSVLNTVTTLQDCITQNYFGSIWKQEQWAGSIWGVARHVVMEIIRMRQNSSFGLSLIHIWRCRRSTLCRSRWSPYH